MILKVLKSEEISLIIVQSQAECSRRPERSQKLKACEQTQGKALAWCSFPRRPWANHFALLIAGAGRDTPVPSGAEQVNTVHEWAQVEARAIEVLMSQGQKCYLKL